MLTHFNPCLGPLSLSLKPAPIYPAMPLATLQRADCPLKSFLGGNLFLLLCSTMSYLCSILRLFYFLVDWSKEKVTGLLSLTKSFSFYTRKRTPKCKHDPLPWRDAQNWHQMVNIQISFRHGRWPYCKPSGISRPGACSDQPVFLGSVPFPTVPRTSCSISIPQHPHKPCLPLLVG